jgi:hypothetical protein
MADYDSKRKRPKTNVEFVKHLMEYSNYGPLAQLFILDAIAKWADIIDQTDPRKVDSAMISGDAWVGVAREIKAKLEQRMKP